MLIDILQEAAYRAILILKERPTENLQEIDTLAETLGIDAVKYADLSCHRVKDYLFSYDKMLNFEGNTAAFLLYAYVRVQGIKRKVQKNIDVLLETTPATLEHPSEVALGLHILQFGEVLAAVEKDLLPNRLAEYLYSLAEKFHAFFRDCRVEGTPEESSRLVIAELTARTLKQGLELLGLKTMPRM